MAWKWRELRRELGAMVYGRKALVSDVSRIVELANPIIPSFFSSTDAGQDNGRGYEPLDQDFKAYMDGLGLFPILSACDDAIGNYAAEVPLKLWRGDQEVESHPLIDLLADPNPEQGYAQLWYAMAQQWGATGNVFISALGTPASAPFANPEELWVLPSDRVKVRVDKSRKRMGKGTSPVVGYCYDADGGKVEFRETEVLHIKRPHPRDPIVGLSPRKELEQALNLLWNAMRSNSQYFKNGAMPGLVLKKEAAVTPEILKRFMEQVEHASSGVAKRGANLYLTGGWDLSASAGNSPKEAEFLGLIDLMQKWILAVRGVPPFAIGLLEHANWSNSVEQQRYFYDRAIKPFNTSMTDAMNTHYLVQAHGADYELRHDYSGIDALSEDRDKQATRASNLFKSRIATRNEAREIVGLDPLTPEQGGEEFATEPKVQDPNAQNPQDQTQGMAGRLAFRMLLDEARMHLAAGRKEDARASRWLAAVRRMEPYEATVRTKMRSAFRRMRAEVMENLNARAAGTLAGKPRPSVDRSWSERLFDLAAWVGDVMDALMPTLTATIRAGHEDITEEAGSDFLPFDISRAEVQQFIAQQTARKIQTVAAGRLDEVRLLVEQAAADGKTVDQLATTLREYFGHDVSWSQRIARTEIHQLYEHGSLLGMEDAGVTTKQWLSARDAFVRPDHVEADGQEVETSGDFLVGGATGKAPGQFGVPEQDINCFPAGTVVQGRIVGALRASYAGPMLEVLTRGGAKLSITPNHPVLTSKGFVPAASIQKGSYLLRHLAVADSHATPALEKDVQNQPATIEQVFDALSSHGRMAARHVAGDDLDGDGRMCHGQIEVVSALRVLRDGLGSQRGEGEGHPLLVGSDVRDVCGPGDGRGAHCSGRLLPSQAGFPCGGALADDGGAVLLQSRPLQVLRLGPAADIDACLAERAGHDPASDSALIGQLLHGHAGQVSLDEVIEVRQFEFAGHVYDLQAEGGWIVAQGIVTSNCRCTTVAGGF